LTDTQPDPDGALASRFAGFDLAVDPPDPAALPELHHRRRARAQRQRAVATLAAVAVLGLAVGLPLALTGGTTTRAVGPTTTGAGGPTTTFPPLSTTTLPGGPTTTLPGGSTTTVPIPPGTPDCPGASLSLTGFAQAGGFAGVVVIIVTLTNTAPTACALVNQPVVNLLSGGVGLDTSQVSDLMLPSRVLLDPGRPPASALMEVYWSNWCGAPPVSLELEATFGSAGSVTGPVTGPSPGLPVCNDRSQPSSLADVDAFMTGPPPVPVPTTTTVPPAGRVVVVTDQTSSPVQVSLGDTVDEQLVSHRYGRTPGQIVPWGTPTSSEPPVLTPTAVPAGVACPTGATCTAFAVVAVGAATLSAVGPSGIICDRQGQNCVGVSAVDLRIQVDVVPRQ
jgi:hypothetical protein